MAGTFLFWPIKQATGGLSTGSRVGLANSYQDGAFIDFKTDPNVMGVLPASQLDSTDTIVDLIRWVDTDGTYTFAYGDTGHIYRRDGDNSYTDLHTAPLGHGQGIGLYADYLYYGMDNQIGRYGPLSGSPTFTDSWATGGISLETEFRPMKNFLSSLFIGNGDALGMWDNAVWTPRRLTFLKNERVRCLEVWGSYLAIGTQVGSTNTVPAGNIYFWDGTSDTYNLIVPFSGTINAMVNDNGLLTAWVGMQGDLYTFTSANGGTPQRYRQMPDIGLNSLTILPGAVGSWNNEIRFGASLGTKYDFPKGIFTWGSQDRNYPRVLSYDYALSDGTSFGLNVSIGAFRALDSAKAIYSWKRGTTYGVDRLVAGEQAPEAVYESLIFDNNKPFLNRRFLQCHLTLNDALRPGEYIKVYLRNETTNAWTLVGHAEEVGYTGKAAMTFQCGYDLHNKDIYDSVGAEHEVKIVWGGNQSTRPAISSLTFTIEENIDVEPHSQSFH